jgi:N-acyl-phosphatidylethanolamine-hydrolysing phospholipase D
MNPSNRKFRNAYAHAPHRFADLLLWKLGKKTSQNTQPLDRSEAQTPTPHFERSSSVDISETPRNGTVRLTWIGHSTFLIQHLGRHILTDPIFGNCQPLPIRSLRRAVPPGISLGDLPRISDVLISHSHYDHLDLPTVRALENNAHYWTPEGLSLWFRRKGIHNSAELRWWNSAVLSGEIGIHCVPAQHGSGRTPFDRDRSHWCGWVLQSSKRTIYFAGDTGYSPSFTEIGERFGGFDLAMLPIGAYQPRWLMKPVHLNPRDAVQAHLDLKSRLSIACHWGTFKLTDEPLSEPPALLARELALKQVDPADFRVMRVGETIEI